jgi:penicillin-binding protein 1A
VFAALLALSTSCGVSARTFPSVLPTNGQQSVILSDDGTVITTLSGDQDREPITLDQIPVILQNAVIAIEDQRFWDHNGIDPRGILRAAKANSSAGGVSQGGSTITQQYVRAVLLTPKRTFQRKIEEASLALQMERSYSKKYILEQYLNTIYFGNRAYGVQVAAKTYFGYGVDDPAHPLSLAQAALLAAILNGPTVFDPYKHADLAITRRNLVLTKMSQLGYITPSQRAEAEAEPIGVVPKGSSTATPQTYPAAHFVDEVKRFVRTNKAFGATEADRDDLLANGGLRIYTTVDLTMQAQAEAAVKQVYPNQARAITDPRKDPDVGLVALDPLTGYVKAMVGGYNFFDTNNAIHSYAQVNLADSGRQVGSTFKPIALAAAVSNGIKMSDVYPSPGSTVIRIPGYSPWTVSGDALGRASLTQCIIHSANTCFANLVADKRVLPTRVTQYASMMGIDTNPKQFDTVPSEVLGTNNTTVLQMTGAYDTFDNNGIFVPPVLVTKVVRADGTVVYQNTHTQRKVLEPDQAASITAGLEGVLTSGTAAGRGIGRPAAGKTGTTQGNTDAWFIGYTPQLVTGVWTGYATPLSTRRGAIGRLRQLPGVGAKMAAPVWQAFMKVALANVPPTDFTTPTGATPGSTTTTVPKGNTDIFQLQTGTPKLVAMPALTPGNTNDASAKAKRQGLHLKRIDATGAPGTLPGQVLAQSPAAGSKVPIGSDITIEATAGNPPPTAPIPDVTGQAAADAQNALTAGGWTVTAATPAPPPAGFLLANGQPPISGQVWAVTPAVGTVSPDGNVTLSVTP